MTDQTDPQINLVHTDTEGEDTAIVSATVDAPGPVVYASFTDPELLAQWFWPQRFGTRVQSDPRPGGAFDIHADGLPAGQDIGVAGVYRDVEEPSSLTMSWQWAGEDAVTQVAVQLTDLADDQTRVVVTHSANPSTTDRDDHVTGWADCLGRLVQRYGTRDLAD